MSSSFAPLDWLVFGLYFALLALSSWWLSRHKISSSREYFLGGNQMGIFAVALSVLATSQSAATFLGVPEYAYKNDFSFIGFYLSALLAALFIAYVLLPKFYEHKVVTVYELLESRYGESAKKSAGVMFLLGRILASGARLYIGALAVSMILFFDTSASHVALSISLLLLGALAYTYFGGVRSVILSDVLQAFVYIGAGVLVLVYLYFSLNHLDIFTLLAEENKLSLFQESFEGNFSIASLLTGWLLLNIAAFGLDQDMTQRLLSCKNNKAAAKSLLISIALSIPVVLLFLSIGALLYLFYAHSSIEQNFEGQSITIFMYYILHEMPEGLRGLVTVGAIAAALSSTNSVLGAMASVAVEDLYKPYIQSKGDKEDSHFIKASRFAVLGFALILGVMALLSYYWQKHSGVGLVTFALGVMAFAYTGLLGVFFAALFSKRGNSTSVLFALLGGFLTVLFLQPYIFGLTIGYAWQIVLGTLVAFGIVLLGNKAKGKLGM
ncbi:MAG: sodium:solute symporter [Helicobacteraceae bacterium]|nr:sodium:solute symporter [Helicobacteraceae bacterium]